MYIDYLSKEEDERFSKSVIAFNTECGLRDDAEKKRIKDRTRILIYRVAKDILRLSPDDASTVYLSLEEDLENIISSYRVSKASYNQYLKQLCQYRCRRMKKKRYLNTLWENAFFLEEARYNARNWTEMDFLDMRKRDNEQSYTEEDYSLYSSMGLVEVVKFITKNTNAPDYPIYSSMEAQLRKALERKTTRKRFLVFLLTLPRKTDGFDSYDIARVLQTEECAIRRLLDIKDEILGYNEDKVEEAKSVASKHWRIMTKLEANIMNERNEEKKRSLIEHYQSQVTCHRKKLMTIRRATRGMTRSEISDYLGIARSTVSFSINEISNLLESIADD